MIRNDTVIVSIRVELKRFAAAVREMLDAQEAASHSDAIMHERQIAQSHEHHVRQWIRIITAETLAEENQGGQAA